MRTSFRKVACIADGIGGFQPLAVGAPGLDILSLRAGGLPVLGTAVGNEYARLSGTSMATPHVAGLTAVLIAGLPGLSLADVRSHLELNADQPGYPGYEGQVWNPYFGFGRFNAARVFDPPPTSSSPRSGRIPATSRPCR